MSKIHIRRPVPPWRQSKERLTFCGRSTEGLSVSDYYASVNEPAFETLICKSCSDTARVCAPNWAKDPVSVVADHSHRGIVRKATMVHELWALAELAERHHAEFAEILGRYDELMALKTIREARLRLLARSLPR